MTSLWTSQAIAQATGGTASAEFDVTGVSFDSREIGPGDLFVALRGEAADGHAFAAKAVEAGAAGLLVSTDVEGPHVRVSDTMAALNDLGRAARSRTSARVIGVTGSVGKTTTKETLFAALERGAPGAVHRSVKSYNNHTGVPLSLSRMPREARFGVFEMGMNHAGEITALTRLVRPHVAIVTAIAPAHIEHLNTMEGIADAKAEIFEGLEPGGTAIVPFDSPYRDRLIAAARPHAGRVLTFGLGEGADARALYAIGAPNGTMVTARLGEAQLSFTVAQPGQHMVSNALAVLAAVEASGGDVGLAALALAELGGLKGRGERHRVPVDGGEALLIDESYNANPASMEATLAMLGAEPVAGRRIAVLGTMRELGAQSEAAHAALAGPIGAADVERVILVGEEMEPLAKALEETVELTQVPDAAAAIAILRGEIAPGDAVLVKGSNALNLARIVDALARSAG
ncbi:MAG TPA: UDP-N-acetylmuramoyl-tripeptide--D-alanyl-D-alanine ligase [Allosphingosinicella sp.]|jgi:UDP-N-acetylmuramoyl-tripeptide--D-alanyl-D-alanine ligase